MDYQMAGPASMNDPSKPDETLSGKEEGAWAAQYEATVRFERETKARMPSPNGSGGTASRISWEKAVSAWSTWVRTISWTGSWR